MLKKTLANISKKMMKEMEKSVKTSGLEKPAMPIFVTKEAEDTFRKDAQELKPKKTRVRGGKYG
jgi:hypothetical protein